jgi:hypothetical protein
MAPPKMLCLGPPLKTRATNKDKHPGEPDMLRPRRKPEEMEQIRQDKADKDKKTHEAQKLAVEGIAMLEDRLQKEDEQRENHRMRQYEPDLEDS